MLFRSLAGHHVGDVVDDDEQFGQLADGEPRDGDQGDDIAYMMTGEERDTAVELGLIEDAAPVGDPARADD